MVYCVSVIQVNTYGALAGYIVGIGLRLLSGEKILGLPPAIKYPLFEKGVQNFPFKTTNMLIALIVEIAVSGNHNTLVILIALAVPGNML